MKKIYKIGIGLVLGATATGGVVIDNQINPYTNKGDRQEIIITQEILETGESKIELIKARPEMRLKKWNGEVNLGVSYSKVVGIGNRPLLSNKMEWKDAKEEVHAYPIDNNNFEFEIVLKEKPDTNVFDFTIDGAENLDFFYQPALTQQEIDEGASRPDNVVGSYAVYHKEKKNHRVGSINYATGKAFHIYRPKAIDANGVEQWAELSYMNGVLTVTIPQQFLDTASFPVRVDPTFGYTSIGGTGTTASTINGTKATAAENGDVSKHTFYTASNGGSADIGTASYLNAGTNAKVAEDSGNFTTTSTTNGWRDINISYSVTNGTVYALLGWGSITIKFSYDAGAAGDARFKTGQTFETWPDPGSFSSAARLYSIYATYTASGGGSPSTVSDIIFFE